MHWSGLVSGVGPEQFGSVMPVSCPHRGPQAEFGGERPRMGAAVMRTTFQLVLIKPTHYDDDGYPITWLRSHIPSNPLAALYGFGEDCRQRQVLGPDVDIVIKPFDETNI